MEKELTEEEKIIKKHLDKAEAMGFDRGVKTVMIELMSLMDEEKMTAISYKSIKALYEKYDITK